MILLSLQLKSEASIVLIDRKQIDEWYNEAQTSGIEFYRYIEWLTNRYK